MKQSILHFRLCVITESRDWSRAWCGDDELRARLRLPLRVRSDANGGDQGSDDVMPPRRPFDN